MKKLLFGFCIFFSIVFTTTGFADDEFFSCISNPDEFNGMVFDNLTIDPGQCIVKDFHFEKLTVTGDLIIMGGYQVLFSGSDLNRVQLFCSDEANCEIGLDGMTSIKELEIHFSTGSSVTVNGLISNDKLPAFYEKGYLCEGQSEFAAYASAEVSIDYQLQDLETFAVLGKIDTLRIFAEDDSSVTFSNTWIHRAFLLSAGEHVSNNITINTTGFAFIDLLDSGISFDLHNQNPAHLYRDDQRTCSYIAGDVMNIGLLLLHSDSDLTVSSDRQYIDYVVFYGAGCDHSTLTLDAYQDTSWATDIFQVHVYDANAEFYTKSIQGVYFLITPDEAPYSAFYRYFDRAETLLRNHRSDVANPEILPYLPDTDSAYWNSIDAALVWSQLMPYYNITPAGLAQNGAGHVYARQEVNVPFIYYHAAFIDKVRVLNAYGASDGLLPDYIQQKDWFSPNPFITGGQVRLCENGGCGFNHQMSIGTVSFATSLRNFSIE